MKAKRVSTRSTAFWIQRGYSPQEARLRVVELQRKSALARSQRIRDRFRAGQKFGWWTVIGPDFKVGERKQELFVKVKCRCDKEQYVRSSNLLNGKSRGCRGCYHKGTKNNRWSGYKDMPGTSVHRIKNGARARGIGFRLGKKYLRDLMHTQQFRCALTNLPLTWTSGSLDRIDPRRSYVVGNVQWVTGEVNYMKHCMSEERFRLLCRLVVENAVRTERTG